MNVLSVNLLSQNTSPDTKIISPEYKLGLLDKR